MINKKYTTATLLLYFSFIISYSLFLPSCSLTKRISGQATKLLIEDTAIRSGHIGISIYEPAKGRYWYEHNGDNFFVPASNVKLFTLYAGMKYLGDSLIGLRYLEANDSTTLIQSTGDPTFLHPDFNSNKIYSFLKLKNKIKRTPSVFTDYLGNGWAWNDYTENYMAQRSDFPLYGNIILVKRYNSDSVTAVPSFFSKNISIPLPLKTGFTIKKSWDTNDIVLTNGTRQTSEIPFRPDMLTINQLLEDTLHKRIETETVTQGRKNFKIIHSQASDSLFKIMMHRSDNFFAEQTLLMASNELLGYMSERKLIDTLLKSDLKDIPQVPRWVDGSGLSRYNLFTPQSFVYLLEKLKKEYSWERLKTILATGNEGTLEGYYLSEKGSIFAKTGTLTSQLALSGYMITKKNKLLIFSVMAGNYRTAATPIRKAIEKFLIGIREKY
ncbi:MAG: D-alanyl-D-alanine carboxypeptidase [Ferruginibacter sp.]